MAKRKDWNDMTKNEKVFGSIGVAIIFVIILITIVSLGRNGDGSGNITEDTAAKACQDVAVTKTQGLDINIIDISNYNAQFTQDEQNVSFAWNGNDDSGIRSFVCELSGTNDNPKVEYLTLDSERLQ